MIARSSRTTAALLLLAIVGIGFGTIGYAADTEPVPAHASFALYSALLRETRHIYVYLPPDYDGHEHQHYPVLYMPDGGLQEDFPHVATDVDAAINTGQMQPMIVIGIENTQRRRDMTAPTTVDGDRKIAAVVGGAAQFRAFIASELMPQVRRRYRTNGSNAIIGESLAGLFVVDTFFEQPRLFDTYIALSPSLWWNNEALARDASRRLKTSPRLKQTFYFASASDDTVGDAAATLQEALRSSAPKGLTWRYEFEPDMHHGDIYRRLSPVVLRTLFPRK